MSLPPRPRLVPFADEHPAALQELADPTIVLDGGQPELYAWSLPAGWTGLVNRLHRELLAVHGEYVVVAANQKMGALRYLVHPRPGPEAQEFIDRAKEESRRTCEVCGAPAPAVEAGGPWTTRCADHPARGEHRVRGAVARPPRPHG